MHSLTGAYVLDAVSSGEQDMFERHLAECTHCRDEIREMREAVVTLAGADAQPPSPAIRERALASAGASSQVQRPGRRCGRCQLRRTALAAAALAVVAAAAAISRSRAPGERSRGGSAS